jgi:phenylacetate-CoA ligase
MSGWDEKLYRKLPIWMQHLACSVEGWRIQHSRFGGEFRSLLKEAENRSLWSAEQIKAYRDQRLQSFIQHCVHTVPFYRRCFREWTVNPEEIQTLEDLQCLPILTKEEVQRHLPELISEATPRRERITVHTSGTTGGGLRFATTRRAQQEQWATWWRYRRWHGIQRGTWCGYFGGLSVVPVSQTKPPFWRYNYPGKQILFSGYHMNSGNLVHYVEELRRRRPPWLHGYPSLLALLAAYVIEESKDLGYEVRWITVGAENLLSQQSKLMKKAFGVRPRQHYGMAEAVANISECEYGALHVDEDFAAVEFIPNPNGPGYRVIGTNFTNVATPLLRYDVGDIVTLSDRTCPCGRPGRIVASIDGRQEDYVVLGDGTRLGRMDHIFKDMVNIREAQIYQGRPGKMTIRVVRGDGYSDDDQYLLLQEARKRVGEDMDISIEYVDHLERSSTGKLRFVVSDVAEGQLKEVGL